MAPRPRSVIKLLSIGAALAVIALTAPLSVTASSAKPGLSVSQLDMVSPQDGWGFGSPGVLRTVDAARTWSVVNPPGVSAKELGACPGNRGDTIDSIGKNRAWFAYSCATYKITICRTSDGGRKWRSATINLRDKVDSFNYPILDFVGPHHGWLSLMASGIGMPSMNGLFETRDGGSTWTFIRPKPEVDSILGFHRSGIGLGESQSKQVDGVDFAHFPYVTHNGGTTWAHATVPAPHGYAAALVEAGYAAFGAKGVATIPVNLYRTSGNHSVWLSPPIGPATRAVIGATMRCWVGTMTMISRLTF